MSGTGARGPIWARPEPGSRRPRFTRDQIAALAGDPAAALLADPARMQNRFERGLRALLDGYPAQIAG